MLSLCRHAWCASVRTIAVVAGVHGPLSVLTCCGLPVVCFSAVIRRWDDALALLLRALSVPDMPVQVQLERSIEAAVLCEGMGLKVQQQPEAKQNTPLCVLGVCVCC